jgi:hypothetical protein
LELLILSINEIVIKPAGTAAIAKTPNNLLELYVKFENWVEIPFWYFKRSSKWFVVLP